MDRQELTRLLRDGLKDGSCKIECQEVSHIDDLDGYSVYALERKGKATVYYVTEIGAGPELANAVKRYSDYDAALAHGANEAMAKRCAGYLADAKGGKSDKAGK